MYLYFKAAPIPTSGDIWRAGSRYRCGIEGAPLTPGFGSMTDLIKFYKDSWKLKGTDLKNISGRRKMPEAIGCGIKAACSFRLYESKHYFCPPKWCLPISTAMKDSHRKVLQLLHPRTPGDLVRLGRNYDGGYVMSAMNLARCNSFISCGLSFDWSFEMDLKRLHPEMPIGAFDRTSGFNFTYIYQLFRNLVKMVLYPFRSLGVQDTPRESLGRITMLLSMNSIFSGNLTFNKKHIGLKSDNKVQSLEELLSERKRYGIKLDVEGTEYELLGVLARNISKVELLLIEFHNLEEHLDETVKFLEAVSTSHYVQHTHGNNYAELNSFGFPDAIEVTIAPKDDIFQACAIGSSYPLAKLDFPNDRRKPDYPLVFE